MIAAGGLCKTDMTLKHFFKTLYTLIYIRIGLWTGRYKL
jgi:hypothetical protein